MAPTKTTNLMKGVSEGESEGDEEIDRHMTKKVHLLPMSLPFAAIGPRLPDIPLINGVISPSCSEEPGHVFGPTHGPNTSSVAWEGSDLEREFDQNVMKQRRKIGLSRVSRTMVGFCTSQS